MEQVSPEINPCTYEYLFFDKGGKNIHWGKDSLFKDKLKDKLKWIKDLNGRPETITLLEGNIGRTLDNISQSKILYDLPPGVMEITKVNKWDLIKSFCIANETIRKVKRQPSEWEKIQQMKQLTED